VLIRFPGRKGAAASFACAALRNPTAINRGLSQKSRKNNRQALANA